MFKSRRIRWTGHVARIGEKRGGKARKKETTRKTRTYVGG
jgi:hypothetical protein